MTDSKEETKADAKSSSESSPQSDSGVKKSHRIRVSGARGQHQNESLQSLFEKFGKVEKVEEHYRQEGMLVITMDSVQSANAAVAELSGSEFKGEKLSLNNDSASQRNTNQRRSGLTQQQQPQKQQQQKEKDSHILRLLVNADSVGNIIGKGGEKIKEITAKSKARIDVRREIVPKPLPLRRSVDSKVVCISGPLDACSLACREILSVCMADIKEKSSKEEVELAILAEARYCGRVIGKEGKNLKAIREKTKTAIQLLNMPGQMYDGGYGVGYGGGGYGGYGGYGGGYSVGGGYGGLYGEDKVISVRGSLDGMCEAEAQISTTLRHCRQTDSQYYMYQLPQQHPQHQHQHGYPPIGSLAFRNNCAPGWPYVTFPALDPDRRLKRVAVKASH